MGVFRLYQTFFVWIRETYHQPDLHGLDAPAPISLQLSANFLVRCWVQRLSQ